MAFPGQQDFTGQSRRAGTSPTNRDLEFRQRLALIRELEAQAQAGEQETRLKDPLEKAKMDASARQFEQRRNVRLDGALDEPALPTGGGRFPPLAAPTAAPVSRNIRRISSGPPPVPSITTDQDFTDPDAAMGFTERAQLHPSVMAAGQYASAANVKGAAAPAPTTAVYSQERANRVKQMATALTDKVSNWTTGIGSVLSYIPGTNARNFSADLDALKSNIAFNELAEMREASKTGGALGAVSERELGLLESALGALDSGQSPQNFKANLEQVLEIQEAWQAAKARAQQQPGPTAGAAPSAPINDRYERYRRSRGNAP